LVQFQITCCNGGKIGKIINCYGMTHEGERYEGSYAYADMRGTYTSDGHYANNCNAMCLFVADGGVVDEIGNCA